MAEPIHPVLQDLATQARLSPDQAVGVLGVLLKKLKENLGPADWQQIDEAFPDASDWIQKAPSTSTGGLMGGLAALGGTKAKLLMEMNQAMRHLGIPTSRAQEIGRILQQTVETHYPALSDHLRACLDGRF